MIHMRSVYVWWVIGLILVVAVFGMVYRQQRTDDLFPTHPQGVIMNRMEASAFVLTSPAFADGATIPSQYTCDGERGLSPTLAITGMPENARSLTLIMDDPDVPKSLRADGVFDHWVLFNIPPDTMRIPEGATSDYDDLRGEAVAFGTPGANSAGRNAYTGPCPPPQYEPSEHRYFFRLYALDTTLSLQEGATRTEVEQAMEGHVIETAELMGRYRRVAQ